MQFLVYLVELPIDLMVQLMPAEQAKDVCQKLHTKLYDEGSEFLPNQVTHLSLISLKLEIMF